MRTRDGRRILRTWPSFPFSAAAGGHPGATGPQRSAEPWTTADVSIVVCTRNRPEMLRSALEAIFASDIGDAEICVVDSASDGAETANVTRDFDVVYTRTEVKGLSIARNAGLLASRRALVLFTDDDCLPTREWVRRVLPHFRDPLVGAVTGRIVDRPISEAEIALTPSVTLSSAIRGIDAGIGAVMAFRRERVLRLGGFDEMLGAGRYFAGAEDLDMFCRVLRSGATIVHDHSCVVRHAHVREGEDYVTLHRGYGLGLGGLISKWLRISPIAGAVIAAVLIKRSLFRVLSRRSQRTVRRSQAAMLMGLLRGALVASRFRVVGEVLVESRDRPIPLADPQPLA